MVYNRRFGVALRLDYRSCDGQNKTAAQIHL
jgi:hypothetical protein